MRHDLPSCAGRLARLRTECPETEHLLVLNANSIRYLTGFTGGDGALMVGPDGPILLVDGRYVTQARGEAEEAEIFEFKNRTDGIAEMVRRLGVGAVGFESPELSVEEYLKLREKLPGVEFRPLSGGFPLLRAVKDDRETARIREAARIAGGALASVREMIRPGVRESEIAVELEYRMRRGGSEKAAFETIVASGPHSALPHATPGNRAIRDGDCVVVDCGAVCGGYRSDETCTFIVGRASERQKEVYGAVREAHDRAIAAIRAGVSCGEIDRVARGVLEEAGLGDYFSHGTGHGVGLDVHEGPRLAPGKEDLLLAGMVVTVEPGVYIPGLWGIRIEDTVRVAEEGCEILTRTPKDLAIL